MTRKHLVWQGPNTHKMHLCQKKKKKLFNTQNFSVTHLNAVITQTGDGACLLVLDPLALAKNCSNLRKKMKQSPVGCLCAILLVTLFICVLWSAEYMFSCWRSDEWLFEIFTRARVWRFLRENFVIVMLAKKINKINQLKQMRAMPLQFGLEHGTKVFKIAGTLQNHSNWWGCLTFGTSVQKHKMLTFLGCFQTEQHALLSKNNLYSWEFLAVRMQPCTPENLRFGHPSGKNCATRLACGTESNAGVHLGSARGHLWKCTRFLKKKFNFFFFGLIYFGGGSFHFKIKDIWALMKF